MTLSREQLSDQAASLAVQGVYVGTSSWKYPGWLGTLYDRARYEWRGKFAETRCKRECLAEYAEVFKTVCVDAAYYTFPSQQYLEGMASQVPEDFLFGFKVTDAITIKPPFFCITRADAAFDLSQVKRTCLRPRQHHAQECRSV